MRTLDRVQPFALFVLRVVLGVIMIAHGYGKIFGGLSHHVELVRSVGLPGWLAYLSAIAEFFGGIAVLIGLFTRFAAFARASCGTTYLLHKCRSMYVDTFTVPGGSLGAVQLVGWLPVQTYHRYRRP